ncbi:hypothetical protein FEE59_02970 [Herbaspirillum sp. RU 5E]|nr:hypothetical protein [Herbaspirillum sp. RU 5E]
MDKEALRQAWERLHKAKALIPAMSPEKSPAMIESAWIEFLAAAMTIYNKLEKGSKTNGKSEAWFGRMKHERKSDPLLSYLHHARNADEHGIIRIATPHTGGFSTQGPGTSITVRSVPGKIDTYTVEARDANGNQIEPLRVPPALTLDRVFDDRFKDWTEVPMMHLGKALPNQSPFLFASLGAAYLENLLREAGTYVS